MALDSTVAKDATVMKSAGYTAPDNASITAIKAKTDHLPSDPASEASVEAAIAAIPAAPSATTIANAVGAHEPISGWTVDRILRKVGAEAASVTSGMTSGAGTTVIMDLNNVAPEITATQDANGNRTAITVNP
jgi:hypothetical protein